MGGDLEVSVSHALFCNVRQAFWFCVFEVCHLACVRPYVSPSLLGFYLLDTGAPGRHSKENLSRQDQAGQEMLSRLRQDTVPPLTVWLSLVHSKLI